MHYEELKEKYNVSVYDGRTKSWRADGGNWAPPGYTRAEGDEGEVDLDAVTKLLEPDPTPNPIPDPGPGPDPNPDPDPDPDPDPNPEQVTKLLDARIAARRQRDYESADSLRRELNNLGVYVDDKARSWSTQRPPRF